MSQKIAKETIKYLFAAGLLKIVVFNMEHSRAIYITILVDINADDGISPTACQKLNCFAIQFMHYTLRNCFSKYIISY